MQWHDIVGGLGAVILLTTYLLLQINRISAKTVTYSVLNAIGSGGILLSLSQAFNFSAFFIEAAWLLISILGICVSLWDRRKRRASGDFEKEKT